MSRVGRYKLSTKRRNAYARLREGCDLATIKIELGIGDRQARQYQRDFFEEESLATALSHMGSTSHPLVNPLLFHAHRLDDEELIYALERCQEIEALMRRTAYRGDGTPLSAAERRLEKIAPQLVHLIPGRS